jgi:hypothetical protein
LGRVSDSRQPKDGEADTSDKTPHDSTLTS